MATRLYVGNLSYDTTEKDLRTLFEQAGTVVKCDLAVDKYTEESRGFGFVEMGSQEEADKAIEQCNGKDLQGRELTVNEARPRAPRIPQNFPSGFDQRAQGKRASGKGSRRGMRNAKRRRKGIF
ncbi:MAG: RNA-binding protein [Phycisphaerales bacterium]|nr:MAG: RNA-binding protein [Phycisphaerales bacterium]